MSDGRHKGSLGCGPAQATVVSDADARGSIAVRSNVETNAGPSGNAVPHICKVQVQEMQDVPVPKTRGGARHIVREPLNEERQVVRCTGCGLTQYVGRAKCPRCWQLFPVKVKELEPEPEPVPIVLVKGRIPLEQFGARLRQLRKAAFMMQCELGTMAHTSRPNISRIEAGRTLPGTDLLQSFAEALGCPVGELLRTGKAPDLFYAQVKMLSEDLTPKQRNEVLVVIMKLSRLVISKGALN